MGKLVLRLALCAAFALGLVGCGGGGNSTSYAGGGNPATQTALKSEESAVLNGMSQSAVSQATTKVDPFNAEHEPALRPLARSPFTRENTFHVYASNGTRKLLRLDFGARQYQMMDQEGARGQTTSGSFSEDPSLPGTYVFHVAQANSVYNAARFRMVQGGVVGSFWFDKPWLSYPSYEAQPFIGANEFATDPAQLDGEYTRMGFIHYTGVGNFPPVTSIKAARISGGGTLLEACLDTAIRRFDLCVSIGRYKLSFDPANGEWKAIGQGDAAHDQFSFRMARIAGRNVWLQGGQGPTNGPFAFSFHVGLPDATSWPSGRYVGGSNAGSWGTTDFGQTVWVRHHTARTGLNQTEGDLIRLVDPAMPASLRFKGKEYLLRDGVLAVSIAGATGYMEIGLVSETLAAEPVLPPSPANGTYRVFPIGASEHALQLNFNAGSYQLTDTSGATTNGTFFEDPDDRGTFVFVSPRISALYNTARFRVATDGIVGAFPFAKYGTNPAVYQTMPFVAARTFVTHRAELPGSYDLMTTGGLWTLRFNAGGTTATQCAVHDCTGPTPQPWQVSAGQAPSQWVLDTGGLPLPVYVAKFGSRRVLLSSTENWIPGTPPAIGHYFMMGFTQAPFVDGNWHSLHTASGTSFGKAILFARSYSHQHTAQDGSPIALSLTLQPIPSIPSVQAGFSSGNASGRPDAILHHNDELFMMAGPLQHYVGLINR